MSRNINTAALVFGQFVCVSIVWAQTVVNKGNLVVFVGFPSIVWSHSQIWFVMNSFMLLILEQWWHSNCCGASVLLERCRVKTGDHRLTIWHCSEISVGGLARPDSNLRVFLLLWFLFIFFTDNQILSFVPMWTGALFSLWPHHTQTCWDTHTHTGERELLSVCNHTTHSTPRAQDKPHAFGEWAVSILWPYSTFSHGHTEMTHTHARA